MVKTLLWAVAIYFAFGVAFAMFLKQTPYADNPLWVLILLWPLFLIG